MVVGIDSSPGCYFALGSAERGHWRETCFGYRWWWHCGSLVVEGSIMGRWLLWYAIICSVM